MTTPRKKWPHAADWARMDAIAIAGSGARLVLEIVDQTDDPAILHRAIRILEMFRNIEKIMKEAKGDQE